MKARILVISFMLGMIVGTVLGMNADAKPQPTIYLTFDDGPSELTPEILEILDKYQIKATFFVTAETPEAFEYMKIAHDKGHVIGLHTASHDYSAIYKSKSAYFQDLNAISEIVKNQIGVEPTFIRFPGGSSNTISNKYCPNIMKSLVKDVTKRGYQYFDWNAEIGDAKDRATLESIIETGKEQVAGKNSVLLLCHDGPTNHLTVKALPTLIEYYLSLGYQFEVVSEEAPGFHHRVP